MIVRTWTGWTATGDAEAYERYMHRMALPHYTAVAGNRGVLMVRRSLEQDRTEFLMISLWDSMDDVRAFVGGEPTAAVFFPEDDDFLVDREREVRHYEVFGSTPGFGASA